MITELTAYIRQYSRSIDVCYNTRPHFCFLNVCNQLSYYTAR